MSILKWTYRFGHIGFIANQYIHNQYVHFYSYKMNISVWTYWLAGGIGRPLYPDRYVHLPLFQSFYSIPKILALIFLGIVNSKPERTYQAPKMLSSTGNKIKS
jgi:hypothetical protein